VSSPAWRSEAPQFLQAFETLVSGFWFLVFGFWGLCSPENHPLETRNWKLHFFLDLGELRSPAQTGTSGPTWVALGLRVRTAYN